MRNLSAHCVAALFLASCRTNDEHAPSRADAPASVVAAASSGLFDGHSLAGWDGDPRFWSVENGCIVGRSTPDNPCEETTYLVWRGGEVGDFRLDFDYRIVGGNSGMQFRSRDAGQWQVAGPQADIEDGPNWSGCLYEQDGRAVVARRGEIVQLEPNLKSATTFGGDVDYDSLAKTHEWNHYSIQAVGPLLELALNGVTTVRVLDLEPTKFQPRGLLAIQLHQGGPMQIEMRDFKLIELPPPSEPAAKLIDTDALRASTNVEPEAGATPPQWLWSGPQARDNEVVALRRTFEAPRGVAKAVLRGTGDDHLRVFVNGELALTSDEWFRPREIDAAKLLRAGENEVCVLAKNDGGIAATWVELVLDGESGRKLRLVTDASWSAYSVANAEFGAWKPAEFDAARAGAAHVIGPVGMEPWHSMGPAMRGEDAKPATDPNEHALAASEPELPEGFVAELLYSVPKGEQGSWVSMCEDSQGRFYVSDQYGPLFRVTPPPIGTQLETRVEKLPLDIGMAQGLCWAFDSLYVVVSEGREHQPGLYRCRDTNGDDVVDSAELLRAFEGGGEHGPHGVVLGPDNKLWITGGNHTKLPEPIDAYFLPKTWAEDVLLPRIDDPNGHAVGVMAPGGWIVRTDENGERWELWAAGFRNAYDIAFDENGELYTFDSDMEWDIGLPWYRPTRICRVPAGSNFGWRNGSGKWPAWAIDATPATCDIGPSSPTGVTFAQNSKFGGRWRSAFYAADWAYGTIYANWAGRFEPFVRGKPFPVTDLVIGRDGAMYVSTGGRRTQSGLYRIRWVGADEPDMDERLWSGADWERRTWAHSSALLAAVDPSKPIPDSNSLEFLLGMLDGQSIESRVARTGIERAKSEDIVALLEDDPEADLVAQVCVAAIHAAPEATRELVLRRLAEAQLTAVPELQRLGLLRALELAFLRLDIDTTTRQQWADKLAPLFPYRMERTDHLLAELLAYLDEPRFIAPALERLGQVETQEEKIWLAYCLRCVKRGWTLEQRRQLLAFLDGEARTFRGGFSLTKYVDRIRDEFVASLWENERFELADVLKRKDEAQTTAASAPSTTFVHAWTKDELAPLVREGLHGRNFDGGRVAFAKARCTECHRMGGEGGATGPDITGAGSRFSSLDLLDAMLTPSATISDQYQDTEVLTRDGDLYVGRIEGDADGVLKLRRLPPQEDLIEIDVAEIESRRPHPLSRMPSGLIDVLQRDEVLDLIAYVLAGANPKDAAFQ